MHAKIKMVWLNDGVCLLHTISISLEQSAFKYLNWMSICCSKMWMIAVLSKMCLLNYSITGQGIEWTLRIVLLATQVTDCHHPVHTVQVTVCHQPVHAAQVTSPCPCCTSDCPSPPCPTVKWVKDVWQPVNTDNCKRTLFVCPRYDYIFSFTSIHVSRTVMCTVTLLVTYTGHRPAGDQVVATCRQLCFFP